MTPRELTNEMLIAWGGADVFNQGLGIARRELVMESAWDERRHLVSGTVLTNGWGMKTSFELFDDGTIRSHCPCRSNQEFGQVCPHVIAVALHAMLSMGGGDDGEDPADGFRFPPEALATREAPVDVALVAEYFEEDGQFALFPVADVPVERIISQDRYVVHGTTGFVCAGGRWFPIRKVVSGPFQAVYTEDQFISREAMPSFIRNNLPVLRRQVEVRMSPTEDMFRFVPDKPTFRLELSGSRAAISARPVAKYGDCEVTCCGPAAPDSVCRPDPDDMLRYHVRNPFAEAAAMGLLKSYGFHSDGRPDDRVFIDDMREVLNFLGGGVPYLRRSGWRVETSEKLEAITDRMPMVVPVVKVSDAPGGAFDVSYEFDAEGRDVPVTEVQRAINRGDGYILLDGVTCRLDVEAVKAMREVFSDCSSQGGAAPGSFRVPRIYGAFVRGSLEALDAVDLDDAKAPNWRQSASTRAADREARYEPVDLGGLESVLRPYQKQGVYWMRFLERSGFSGLLADEMGLGKTLQTLTWLSLERTDPAARGKPALVVCPTSLVRNWEAEAAKFVPGMKRLVISGPDRAALFPRIREADLVITSYALLQRDLDEAYRDVEFSVAILDEAQHIKNRTTRNAKSAKAISSVQKLVLTGTPVENSVSDVWSIYDFLLPDYLGAYDLFKATVEEPIGEGGKNGVAAQERLRHKIGPFILRRLKKDVAKDLPDKIERVVYCPMAENQQRWYVKLLAETRGKIGDLVKEKGFAKSRMEILSLLMRLRQVANSVELLKEVREHGGDGGADNSGKLDSFFELMDEAIDGGHRVLVFSQFVGMLTILRRELDRRGVKYCYLDGSTKDRLGACRTFNSDESIPLFLISLHAGGTGLNLTGADMVVHFDPWWNPAVEAQATDRAHRIGQKRTVYVVKMISESSVEERVLALQRRKQQVIDATVGTTDVQAFEAMTYDDVKALVGL